MQVTQTSAEGLKREFKVVIEAKEIEEKVDARLTELSQTVRLPGFRPGKVPVSLIKTRYGGAVRGEILEDALTHGAEQAISENELRPVVQPKIEVTKFEEGADLEYTMSLEVMPEIEPTDATELELERLVSEVGDEDVERALERMATQSRSFKAAEPGRAAQSGDALVIDFVGKIDGEAFEGGSAEGHQLELGSSSFIGTFEDQLIGAKAGDRKDLDVIFPEEYVNEQLAGKAARFEVDVKEVKEAVPVAVDDQLAENLGMENLEALRKAVREQIERERGALSRARLKRSVLDALAERHDFEVPPSMFEIEFEAIWKQLEQDLERAGTTLEETGRSEDEVKEEYRGIAARRVRLGLVLSEIGRHNNIEVQQDELNRAMVEHARGFPGEERKVLEYFQQNPEAANHLRAPLFEDTVVDFILEMANVTERTVSVDELLQDSDEEGAETPADTEAARGEAAQGEAAQGEVAQGEAKVRKGRRKTAKAEAESAAES